MVQLEKTSRDPEGKGSLCAFPPRLCGKPFSELLCNWTSRATQGTRAARKQMGQEQVVVVD